jgi:transposase
MRRIIDVLRLKFDGGLSDRNAGRSLRLARTTVRDYVLRFKASGLAWPLAPEVDEEALERALFKRAEFPAILIRPLPDWALINKELKRKGVTLQLLWHEYVASQPTGYRYSQFAAHYRCWLARLEPVMRQVYKAGEKAFVDYAGVTVDVVDTPTGELRAAQIFVAALGASNYTYAEATWTQQLHDWIGSHVRAVEYFGGSPELWVPDNLRSGVTRACNYEPLLNQSYADFAAHYQSAVLPARVRRPRDKAKAETHVQIAEREILAPLRNRTFTSLAELNAAIRELLEILNNRPFQKLEGSRRELFDAIERPALKPLPGERHEYAETREARVSIDYHISVDRRFYSVPYQLVREKVLVRMTGTMVEILHKGKRVAAHTRSKRRGSYTTDRSHLPKAHQKHLEWSPSRLIRWGQSVGSATGGVFEEILRSKPHPEIGYRACLGIIALGRRYGNDRLDAASTRALRTGTVSYSSVKSILKSSLDRAPIDDEASATRLPKEHENIRGPEYYGSGDAQLTLLADDTTMGGDPDRSDDRSAVTEQMGPTTFPEMLPILTNHAQTPTTGGI